MKINCISKNTNLIEVYIYLLTNTYIIRSFCMSLIALIVVIFKKILCIAFKHELNINVFYYNMISIIIIKTR